MGIKMGNLTSARKLKIKEAAGNRCEIPKCKSKAYDVHHIKPSSEGGSDVASNLIVLCANHHDDADKGRITRTGLRNIAKNRKDEVKREIRNILKGGVKTGPKRKKGEEEPKDKVKELIEKGFGMKY